MADRSLGVTIICILGWIFAFLGVLFGLASMITLALSFVNELGAYIGIFVGIVIVAISALQFISIYWLWKMQKNGWLWTIIIQGVLIIIGLMGELKIIYNPYSGFQIWVQAVIVIYLWLKKNLFK
jgi:hypothetical protein